MIEPLPASRPQGGGNANPSSEASGDSPVPAVYFDALLDADNSKGDLRVGMTALVPFTLGRTEPALVVPLAAVNEAAEGATVNVLHADGRTETRPVRLGQRDAMQAQVAEGLREGDRVMLRRPAGT